MNSRIYKGWVRHRRLAPTRNRFRYRLFMLYLDLAELPRLFDGAPVLVRAATGASPGSSAATISAPHSVPLDRAVRDLVEAAHRAHGPRAPIRLLTHLRYFGYCMNPVSFYYCFNSAGDGLETIVAEITNTPWKERHQYVLPVADAGERRNALRVRQGISRLAVPADGNAISMVLQRARRASARAHAEFPGRRAACSTPRWRSSEELVGRGRWCALLAAFPLMTLKVIAAIHWQALKLWVKRTPFYDASAVTVALGSRETSLKHDHHSGGCRRLAQKPPCRLSRGCARALLLGQLGKMRHGRLRLIDGASERVLRRLARRRPVRRHHPRARSALLFGHRVRRNRRRRRGVHQRLLGLRRSHRPGAAHGGQSRVDGRRRFRLVAAARAAVQGGTLAQSQRQERQPAQHRGALRSGQPVLRAVSRRDAWRIPAESSSSPTAPLARGLRRQIRCGLQQARAQAGAASAGDRHGLGRARDPRRAALRTAASPTTTISREQFDGARERIARAGLEARITLLLEDYRDLRGSYDALVSIEMVEAVGHQYLDAYFGNAAAC